MRESAKSRLDASRESAAATGLDAPRDEGMTRESTLALESSMVEEAVEAVVSVSAAARGAA